MGNFLSGSDGAFPLKVNFNIHDEYEDENDELKFDLYLMTREIKQITDSLRQITLLPRPQQKTWVRENEELVNSFMARLTHEVFSSLDELELDPDSLQETIVCVAELRELVNTLHGLTHGSATLKS